jgi:hypothetical protein
MQYRRGAGTARRSRGAAQSQHGTVAAQRGHYVLVPDTARRVPTVRVAKPPSDLCRTAVSLFVYLLYLRFLAASDFFLRFTLGFS